MLYTFLDMSHTSVVCLSLRSAGVGIVGVRSAGVGIAGVRSAGVKHRSREARRRRASMLVYSNPSYLLTCILHCTHTCTYITYTHHIHTHAQITHIAYLHYTHTHARTHTRTHTHMHTDTHTHTHTHTHKYLQTHIASWHHHLNTKLDESCEYLRLRSCSRE